MPVVQRTTIPKKAVERKRAAVQPVLVELPTEPTVPSDDLNEYHFLIHGEKKIGKTTFCMTEGKVFLMTFDPAQKALAIIQRHLPDWRTFMQYLAALEAAAQSGGYPYTRVVIDGADIWYRHCQDYVCKKLVIDHPSEEGWGKGWDTLRTEFQGAVDRLLALPGGCWFISHSVWSEIETRNKNVKINKLVPLMKRAAEEALVGKVDGWFAYDYHEKERVLIVVGDERTGAGHRVRGHFLTPDGRRVVEIPMGASEDEAYGNFKKAFANEQTFTTISERDAKKGGKPAARPVARKPA